MAANGAEGESINSTKVSVNDVSIFSAVVTLFYFTTAFSDTHFHPGRTAGADSQLPSFPHLKNVIFFFPQLLP